MIDKQNENNKVFGFEYLRFQMFDFKAFALARFQNDNRQWFGPGSALWDDSKIRIQQTQY